jgi:hypothetical protein
MYLSVVIASDGWDVASFAIFHPSCTHGGASRRNAATTFARNLTHKMNFSLSTFVVEVNGKAQIAFQTKWHGDAEQIGLDWVKYRSDRFPNDGHPGLPPIVKIRVARPHERAAYQDDKNNSEFYADVKIVYLPEPPDQAD